MRDDTPAEPPAPTEGVPDLRPAVPDPLDAFPTEAEVAAAEKIATAERIAAAEKAAAAARSAKSVTPPGSRAAQDSHRPLAATIARRALPRTRTAISLLLASAVVVAAVLAWLLVPGLGDRVRRVVGLVMPPTTGTLVIETTPPGWEVIEAGRRPGHHPVPWVPGAGKHALLLRSGGETRPLDVVLAAGVEVVHHLDLQAAPSTGVLSVPRCRLGATVEVDGLGRGASPVDVVGLAPGDHAVSVIAGNRTVTEQVTVAAGQTTTLLVPVARPEAAAGSGRLCDHRGADRTPGLRRRLAGRQQPQPAHHADAGRARAAAGEPGARIRAPWSRSPSRPEPRRKVTVPVPNGSLSVNAVPWAEVRAGRHGDRRDADRQPTWCRRPHETRAPKPEVPRAVAGPSSSR